MTAERIQEQKVLLVEGYDEKFLYEGLIDHLNLQGIQVVTFDGVCKMERAIQETVEMPGFRELVSPSGSFGIIRDAETDAANAFQAVEGALVRAKLKPPSSALTWSGRSPRIGVLIQPPCKPSGMLEDLCLEAVAANPCFHCIDALFRCVTQAGSPLPTNLSKAKAHAFLATRDRPGLRIGEAGKKGYWHWNSPTWDSAKKFLREM